MNENFIVAYEFLKALVPIFKVFKVFKATVSNSRLFKVFKIRWKPCNRTCTANMKGEAKSKKLCFNCGSAWSHSGGNSKCPAQCKTCRKCDRKNHFSNCCRSKERKIVKQVQDEICSDSSDESYCYQVKGMKINNVDTGVALKIQNRFVRMKIDTGADVS